MSKSGVLIEMKRKVHRLEVALQHETDELFDVASATLKGTISYTLKMIDLGGGRMNSRPKILSVSGLGSPELFEKISRDGLPPEVARVLNSRGEDLSIEDLALIEKLMRNEFMSHLIENRISYDELIDAISAVHNLNGAILGAVA